jgi:CheY-like chemotaxis protein
MRLDEATIMVVDDEPFLRECYSRWLQMRGCRRVVTAANGQAALSLIERDPFDALISDIHMPLMDGLQLIRTLRERGIVIPSIIFVSGYLTENSAEIFDLGVECMLAKPFRSETLLREVETSLADRRDLWHTPMADNPGHEVRIERVTPGPTADSESICFGRGGFCAPISGGVQQGPVNFVITLADESQEMRGQGNMLWYSPQTHLGAVQMEYLHPDSRERLLQLVTTAKPGRFIPAATSLTAR